MPKQKKPLIIDCQVFQTAAWHRGMGKYSLAFLKSVLEYKQLGKSYEIYCLFSTELDENSEAMEAIKKLSPSVKFLLAELSGPQEAFAKGSIKGTQKANKAVLDALIGSNFKQSAPAFLILSLYLDEACPVFPAAAADKLLVYYDSIPYLYHDRYEKFIGFFENFYMPHTATVYEATKLLTISKTVANDLCIVFGLPKERIFVINGASIPRSSKTATKTDNPAIKPGNFILMPTGQELRKNNLRAARAFSQFITSSNHDVKLVITSHFTEDTKAQLQEICKDVIFSGNVSENEITWLYENCRFVLFPSEYEGLGLPILEAAEKSKPIACSDISVFREMSTTAFSYFDPLDIDSMSEALETLYRNEPTRQKLEARYKPLLSSYSWTNTSDHFLAALEAKGLAEPPNRKKVAIFCPDPSGFSAIGKVVTESHAWYSQYFDITYYFDQGPNHTSLRPNPLPYLVPCYDISDFKPGDSAKYEALIYHVGNSEYHGNIIQLALAVPGYAVIHDTYLSGAYAYLRDKHYISEERASLEDKLDDLLPDNDRAGMAQSANLTSLVNNQQAIIVHSSFAQKAVEHKLMNNTRVGKLNLPVDTPMYPEIVHSTAKTLQIAFAGIIARIKGTDIIYKIARLEEFEEYNISIFGYNSVEPERLEPLKELPHVKLISDPSDHEFQKLMANTDILMNVRMAYRGETSLTTLEAMRYGVVVMVRDFGWYKEIPEDTVIHIQDVDDTIQQLRDLIADKSRLGRVKKASQLYVQQNFSHQKYAEDMYELIDKN